MISAAKLAPARLSRTSRWILLVLGACGIVVCGWVYWGRQPPIPAGVPAADYQRAAERFRQLYPGRETGQYDVLSLLGELAVQEERWPLALQSFQLIPTSDPAYGLSARLQQGQVHLKLNQAAPAENSFREYLANVNLDQARPELVRDAFKRLAYLLSVELRFEERQEVLAQMQALGLTDVYDAKQRHFPNLLLWNSPAGRHRLRQFLKETPDDVTLQIAQGRYLTAEGKLPEARTYLANIVNAVPENSYALAALLECAFEQNDWAFFLKLFSELPPAAEQDPWLLTRLRGEKALHEQDWEQAITHFEKLLQADAANPWSHMGLARAYGGLKRTAEREQALQESLTLSRIRVDLMTVNNTDASKARHLMQLCQAAGLADAAATFRRHAQQLQVRNRESSAGYSLPTSRPDLRSSRGP